MLDIYNSEFHHLKRTLENTKSFERFGIKNLFPRVGMGYQDRYFVCKI